MYDISQSQQSFCKFLQIHRPPIEEIDAMYSKDLVKRAVAYKKAGHTLAELEEAFGIPAKTYYRCKKKLEDGYYDRERPPIKRKRKIDKETLIRLVAEKPDLFHSELAVIFGCTAAAIALMLKKLKLTRKKNYDVFRSVGRTACCFLETSETYTEEKACLH